MPRTARAIVGGLHYHVINRGNHRARVFHDEKDYRSFLRCMREGQVRFPVRLLSACLMPNHFHLVVRPETDAALADWMHWFLTTFGWHHRQRHETNGRLWQGRFKLFPIQSDAHLMAVMRYVERNALRAGLVQRAEAWPWGSLCWRLAGSAPLPLASPPAPLPGYWQEVVNRPQSQAEVASIRTSVTRQRPFGSEDWVASTASSLGLEFTLRSRGRPPGGKATTASEADGTALD